MSARLEPGAAARSAAAAEAIEPPPRLARWTLWALVAFLAAAIAWAALARVDVVTVGEGQVVPASRVQVVQSLEGGIVSEIYVKLGQAVDKDAPLMRIDDTRFKASFREGQAKDQAMIARIARLAAEAGGAPMARPAGLDAEGERLFAQERALHDKRRQELQATLAVLQQQAEQRRQELTEKRAREQQLRQSLELASRELSITRPLLPQGVVSEVDVLRLERQVNDLQGELQAARLAAPRLEAAIRETEQKGREAAERFRAEAARELNLLRGEQLALSAANTALEDRVTRTLLKAPLAGTIKDIGVNTLGGVVQPGQSLVEIVPAEDALVVEARVRPSDVAFLQPGQPAMVKISAYDFSIYGGFAAVVEDISADTLVPERAGERTEPYYRVRVRTQGTRLSGAGERLAILPGMTATVDIKTGQRTVLQYLLKPVIKTKESALRER